MIENYSEVRERIARFMGRLEELPDNAVRLIVSGHLRAFDKTDGAWRLYLPDPLNNPADAWALQCAINHRDPYYIHIADYISYHQKWRFCIRNNASEWTYWGEGKTPAEALVRAWMEAFPDE